MSFAGLSCFHIAFSVTPDFILFQPSWAITLFHWLRLQFSMEDASHPPSFLCLFLSTGPATLSYVLTATRAFYLHCKPLIGNLLDFPLPYSVDGFMRKRRHVFHIHFKSQKVSTELSIEQRLLITTGTSYQPLPSIYSTKGSTSFLASSLPLCSWTHYRWKEIKPTLYGITLVFLNRENTTEVVTVNHLSLVQILTLFSPLLIVSL